MPVPTPPPLLAWLLPAGLLTGLAAALWARRRIGREVEARCAARIRDLSEQLAARTDELRESEARIQGFLRHAPAAIAVKGLDGRLLLVNRKAEALVGLFQAATPNGCGENLFPPDILARGQEQDTRVLSLREQVQSEESVTLPDGSVRDYLIQKFPITDALGQCRGVGVIATNVSLRRQDERAHLQHRKLDALRLMAGGIAHDFNNILSAMLGNVELARLELGPLDHLVTLEELLSRAEALVCQFLAYAGLGQTRVQALDLNLLVEDVLRLLRATQPPAVALHWAPAAGLPFMKGDAGQVKQVILNLIVNGLEAVGPEGGAVTLRTGWETVDRTTIATHFQSQALKPGRHLALEVADTGPGIAPEVLERIFDPFFTTKSQRHGLGLATVQGIVRNHSGGLRVTSAAGRGTTFKVLFPAVAEAGARAGSEPDEQATDFHGAGTILVVDDEDAVRAVAARALRRMGFEILEARDGLEALAVFAENWDKVRLILLDLTMPRMGGEETYRELRKAGALAPIILSSGFRSEEARQRFQGLALAGFLQKPYRLRALAETIRNVLEDLTCTADRRGRPPRELVAWIPEYATGHPEMDAQHKHLLRAFNRLAASAEDKEESRAGSAQALGQLTKDLGSHCAFEEELMAGAAGAAGHRADHERLLKAFEDEACLLQRGDAALTPAVLNRLEDTLLNHIQLEDRELARQLEKGS
jgi:hemerythrin-like metal-binding protein/PAS domain S-box-containing protein